MDVDTDADGDPDTLFFYEQNIADGIVRLIDAGGNTEEIYIHRPLHAPAFLNATGGVVTASANGNPYLLKARRLDPETGLYYNRARYLDYENGVFLSRDPMGQWFDPSGHGNGYTYAGGDLMFGRDPSGLNPVFIRVANASHDTLLRAGATSHAAFIAASARVKLHAHSGNLPVLEKASHALTIPSEGSRGLGMIANAIHNNTVAPAARGINSFVAGMWKSVKALVQKVPDSIGSAIANSRSRQYPRPSPRRPRSDLVASDGPLAGGTLHQMADVLPLGPLHRDSWSRFLRNSSPFGTLNRTAPSRIGGSKMPAFGLNRTPLGIYREPGSPVSPLAPSPVRRIGPLHRDFPGGRIPRYIEDEGMTEITPPQFDPPYPCKEEEEESRKAFDVYREMLDIIPEAIL